MDELLAIAGTEFSGIEAGLTKEKELQEEIFEKALTNAREQAEKTLKTMDMKIDSVFAVSPVPFPEIRSSGCSSSTEKVIVPVLTFRRAKTGSCGIPTRTDDSQPEHPRHLSDLAGEIDRLALVEIHGLTRSLSFRPPEIFARSIESSALPRLDSRCLKRAFLIFALFLLAGGTGVYLDWIWKRPLSPRGGRYYFHRLQLPVPSFRQGDEKWEADALGGVPENGTLGSAGCAVAAVAMVFRSYGILAIRSN